MISSLANFQVYLKANLTLPHNSNSMRNSIEIEETPNISEQLCNLENSSRWGFDLSSVLFGTKGAVTHTRGVCLFPVVF